MCEPFFNCFSKTNAAISEFLLPQNPFVAVVSMFGAWYMGRVFLTYGPGLLADWCIEATVQSIGNEIIGKAVGAACVAPVMVPTMVPIVAWIVGGITAIVLTIIGNLFSKAIMFLVHKCQECHQAADKEPADAATNA